MKTISLNILYFSQDENLSPFDAFVEGESTQIVSKDEIVGNGDVAAEIGDVLTVGLTGTVLKLGKQFVENESFVFEMGAGDTFPGFNEGLLGSTVGTKRLIKVPPNLAYGKRGAKGVPPMSDLIFEVEVKGVARNGFEKILAKIGTDRLIGFAILIALLGITPLLPQ